MTSLRQLARHPLARRVGGYGAGSVIAAATSELAFVVALGWFHAGTTASTAAGFVGGAVPNYVLNRRWAWPDRRGRNRRLEVALYTGVALSSFLAAAVVTHWAAAWARSATNDHGWTVALAGVAYLAVSGLFFVVKFVLYHLVVFTTPPELSSPPPAGSTRY